MEFCADGTVNIHASEPFCQILVAHRLQSRTGQLGPYLREKPGPDVFKDLYVNESNFLDLPKRRLISPITDCQNHIVGGN